MKKLGKKKPDSIHLLLEKENQKEKYTIYDLEWNPKYSARCAPVSMRKHIMLYDQYGSRVGTIKEKLVELVHKVYNIEIDGQDYGTIKESSITGLKYYLEPLHYLVERNISGSDISVFNEKKEKVVSMSSQGIAKNYYTITIKEPELEIATILIVLAFRGKN